MHSFQTLLADLATLARNTVVYRDDPGLSAHRRDPADGRSAEGIRAVGGWRVASRAAFFLELLNESSRLRFLKKEAPLRAVYPMRI